MMDAIESWYNDGFLIGLRQATEIPAWLLFQLPEGGPPLASMQGEPFPGTPRNI